jgi:serine protease
MSGIGRLLCVLALGGAMSLLRLGVADAAAAPEWNPVRTHAVQIGPEARRLVVGFRATAGNAVVKSIRLRSRAQSVKITEAMTTQADVAGLAQRTGLAMARSRQLTPSMHVMYLQKTLYGAQVKAALKTLRADAAVEFADVDRRRYPQAATVPDDPLFLPSADASGQWFMGTPSPTTIVLGGVATMDLSATDAVSAWSITKGSSGTVIADVDTGIRFDHPDLLRAGFGGRLLPGYDFVDEDYDRTTGAALGTFLIANDGDGWDPDPSDPGDWISTADLKNPLFPPSDCGDPSSNNGPSDSSWHGTRVMGVLGALTNNGVGLAGMTWNPYLLPVRSLGKCGGYDSDIIAGMQWAAGMTVTDPAGNAIPDNPYPADIVNLSLGGTDACPSDYKTVITTLTGMGVVVVASAGNGGAAVDTPGNCPGVLAVVGLRNVGTKVGYSSMGAEAGIAAPAGNCVVSTGGCYRSIDTTVNEGLTVPTTNSYTDQTNYNLGTSFSAPIVSGVVALMRAVNANLTPSQLIARIKSSATAFPQPAGLPVCPNTATDPSTGKSTGECACPNDGSECGAGMVNALSAVNAALKPIAVITKSAGSNTTFDAGGSVAACGLTVASYAWVATGGGITIQGSANAAQVTVSSNGSAGTLTLTVTDNAGHVDNTGTVSFNAAGVATVNAPAVAGTAATACPTPMTVTPAPPTITEAFSPTTVTIGDMPTLTITFNNANGFDLTQASFTETLPTGLTIETSPAPSTTCTGTSGSLTTTASTVTLTGADIPPKGNCSITLTVGGAAGTYANAIAVNALMTGPAGGNTAAVSASLTVNSTPPLPVPSKKSGGGELDWLDMMFVAGVLLVGRRQAGRQAVRRPAVRRPAARPQGRPPQVRPPRR